MFFCLLQKLSGLTKLQLARLSKKLEKEAAQARDLRTAAFKVSNAEPGSILNSILRHSEPDPREFPTVLVSVDFFFFFEGREVLFPSYWSLFGRDFVSGSARLIWGNGKGFL